MRKIISTTIQNLTTTQEKPLYQTYKAFLFDVDGTLTDPEYNHQIPHYIINKHLDMIKDNKIVGYVTARGKSEMQSYCQELVSKAQEKGIVIKDKLYLFPASGAEGYEITTANNKLQLAPIYSHYNPQIQDIKTSIDKIGRENNFELIPKRPPEWRLKNNNVLVLERGSQITLEFGNDIQITHYLEPLKAKFPDFRYLVHGTRCIHIVPENTGKFTPVTYLEKNKPEIKNHIAAIGDSFFLDEKHNIYGNDMDFCKSNATCIQVGAKIPPSSKILFLAGSVNGAKNTETVLNAIKKLSQNELEKLNKKIFVQYEALIGKEYIHSCIKDLMGALLEDKDPNFSKMIPLIRKLRHNSIYFQKRREQMQFIGMPSDIRQKQYLISSEEMAFYMLPLLKRALQQKKKLFFIERGAYPMKLGVDHLADKLGYKDQVKTYSFKLGLKPTANIHSNQELAEIVEGFIEKQASNRVNEMMTPTEQSVFQKQFQALPQDTQRHLENALQKEFTSIELLAKILKTRSKLSLIKALIKSDPAPHFLEDVKIVSYNTRWKIQQMLDKYKKNNKFTPDCFQDKKPSTNSQKQFLHDISDHLNRLYPEGGDIKDSRKFQIALMERTLDYTEKKSEEFKFAAQNVIAPLVRSFNINLDNTIYCDDAVGTAIVQAKAKLFHKLFSDTPMDFNIFCNTNVYSLKRGLPRLARLSYITQDIFFIENNPECFDMYYEPASQPRIFPKRKQLQDIPAASTKEIKRYNEFLKNIDTAINETKSIQEIFANSVVKHRLSAYRLSHQKANQIMVTLLLDPFDIFTKTYVQQIGHSGLLVKLRELAPKAQDDLENLKKEYNQIKDIHQKIIAAKLRRNHEYFMKKLTYFDGFYTLNSKQIHDYLHCPVNTIANTQLIGKEFNSIAEAFYKFTDTKECPHILY